MTGWGWRLGKDLERRDAEVYNRNKVPSTLHILGVRRVSHYSQPLAEEGEQGLRKVNLHCVPGSTLRLF